MPFKNLSFIAALIAVMASVAFSTLWLQERQRKPLEVIKEVVKPTEVIREVPVERIKEIPKETIKEVEVIKTVEVPASPLISQIVTTLPNSSRRWTTRFTNWKRYELKCSLTMGS